MATCGVPWMMGGTLCMWGCGVRREEPAQVSRRLASGQSGRLEEPWGGVRGCTGKETPGTRGPAAGEFALTVGLRWSSEGRCPEGRWRLCERRGRDRGGFADCEF